jgi:hypothetical protein
MANKIGNCFFTTLLFVIGSCGNVGDNNDYVLELDNYIPPNSDKVIFAENYKSYSLTRGDIKKCEHFIRQEIDYNNRDFEKKGFHNSFTFEEYGRQYLAAIAPNGHIMVYVNCFCNPDDVPSEEDKHVLIIANDGGNCYFNLLIDLTSNLVISHGVNGVG